VTGAYGFIGSAYCAHLAAAGRPYVGAVRTRRAAESRSEIVAVGDFSQANWASAFDAAPVDAIVHLAARAHRMDGGANGADAADYRRENVEVTERLLAAARGAGVKRFVFASTVKVHGESTPPGTVLRESDPLAPADDYARSKAAAEDSVRAFERETGIATVILRLPLVYGAGVRANFAHLVDAVRRRRVLPLGAIVNQRSLAGIGNVCGAIDCALAHPAAGGETFFVSDGDDVSTPELVRAIAAALGVRPRLWRVPTSLLLCAATLAGRGSAARRLIESLAVDDAKIRRSLGWKPPLTLADELRRLAAEK
jgi:nucleoside-diphosphate-sugar epimerase